MTRSAQKRDLLVLGIETSCDETAAAVVVRRADGSGRILSNLVRSQIAAHAAYGGVVPEIAARAHLEVLDVLVQLALDEAGIRLDAVDGIAATAGPGLIGGLIVGLTMAKAMALAADKPLIAVNHLEAHALTPGLTDGIDPPYLLLLVSGGHTQLVVIEAIGRYRRLGTTLDDALGEAFDKTAKVLGLGYPGGPQVEQRAKGGDPHRFALPRPMLGRADANFSFAGLKTAVRQRASEHVPLTERDVADLCAGFQAAVAEVVADRVRVALELAARSLGARPVVVIAGGVAANGVVRAALEDLAGRHHARLVKPPLALCTDNAAMIAWAGAVRLARGLHDGLDVAARPRWPLDEAAAPLLGGGRAGPKA